VSGGVLCVLGVAVVARVFPELAAHVVRTATRRAESRQPGTIEAATAADEPD